MYRSVAPGERYFATGPLLTRATPWAPDSLPPTPNMDPDRGTFDVDEFLRCTATLSEFLDALWIASPATAERLEQWESLSRSRRHQLAVTVSRYARRAAGRATPLGRFAGVAVGSVGDRTRWRMGDRHRVTVRPDAAWLADLGRRTGRTVHTDPWYRIVGDRLYRDTPDGTVSIRHNALVGVLLEHAARPVPRAELIDTAVQQFPGVPVDGVSRVLDLLLDNGFLLPDRPAPTDLPAPVITALNDYTRHGGVAAHRRLRDRLAEHGPAAAPQVDLLIDAELTLPTTVLAEISDAVDTLWRLAPPRGDATELAAFTTDFVERYGLHHPIPLATVLDPITGIGLPAGHPSSTRTVPPAPHRPIPDALAAAVQQAGPDGSNELDITDALRDTLTQDGDAPAWRSLDVTVQLVADSPHDIDTGQFTVVLAPNGLSRRAGQVTGRFADALGITAALRDTLRGDAEHGGPTMVQLEYRPTVERIGNVTAVPRLFDTVVDVCGGNTDIPVSELFLTADGDGLTVVDSTGRELEAVQAHMANPNRYAPGAARLLGELETARSKAVTGWQWHGLEALPRLPRVRRGRTVLCPARWRPGPVVDRATDWVDDWRRRWRVPRHVLVHNQTQHYPLDLDNAWHRLLLADELRRRPESTVFEDLAADGLGWTGGVRHEITTMVFASPHHRRPAAPVTPPRRRPRPHRLPGGDWLHLRLITPLSVTEALLAEAVNLLPDLPVDRWFFVRYPHPQPHLRWRLHGDPTRLTGEVLPRLHDWATRLTAAGILSELEIAEYRPETHRYGHGDTLVAAEEFFTADSALVAGQLTGRTAERLGVHREVLAVWNLIDLLSGLGWTDWPEWIDAVVPAADRQLAPRDHRRAALAAVPPDNPAPTAPGFAELSVGRIDRATAAAAYRKALAADPDAPALPVVAADLLHMHLNRLLGPDRTAERRVMSILREVTRAHRARRTTGGQS